MTAARCAAKLERALEDERAALLQGRFDRLDAIAQRKNKLQTQLMELSPTERLLTRIRNVAARNARLIEASLTGMAAGRERLETLAKGPPRDIYSANGERGQMQTAQKTLARRV